MTGDGAEERSEEKTEFGAVATPLGRLSAAQRHGRRGSLPPKLFRRFSRSVASRTVSKQPSSFESHIAKEMNTWP
jgi:hypothetical protein